MESGYIRYRSALSSPQEVNPDSYLSLCREVEEGLNGYQQDDFFATLRYLIASELKLFPVEVKSFQMIHASWQQRIHSAAKVKGLV